MIKKLIKIKTKIKLNTKITLNSVELSAAFQAPHVSLQMYSVGQKWGNRMIVDLAIYDKT